MPCHEKYRSSTSKSHADALQNLRVCPAVQGLGLEYARQAVNHGARNLVVISREPTLPLDTLREFAEQGVALWVVRCNASSPTAMRQLWCWVHEHLPAVQHFGHAAGRSGFDMLQDMPASELSDITLAKVSLLQGNGASDPGQLCAFMGARAWLTTSLSEHIIGCYACLGVTIYICMAS